MIRRTPASPGADAASEDALRRALRGPWELHRRTRDLDFFLLSSSITDLPGGPGAAVGAAVDAFNAALAGHRWHEGLPGVSVAWGPWPDTDPERAAALAVRGVFPASHDALLDALGRVLTGSRPQAGVARVDWQRFVAAADRSRRTPR